MIEETTSEGNRYLTAIEATSFIASIYSLREAGEPFRRFCSRLRLGYATLLRWERTGKISRRRAADLMRIHGISCRTSRARKNDKLYAQIAKTRYQIRDITDSVEYAGFVAAAAARFAVTLERPTSLTLDQTGATVTLDGRSVRFYADSRRSLTYAWRVGDETVAGGDASVLGLRFCRDFLSDSRRVDGGSAFSPDRQLDSIRS